MDDYEAFEEDEARRQILQARRWIYTLAVVMGLAALFVLVAVLLFWGGAGIP